MAGQDELIYVVKFVPNEQSLADIQKALADAEKKARASKPKTKSAEHKEEIKALDDLTKRYIDLTKGMADTNEQVRGYKLQLKELEAIRRKDGSLTDEQADAEIALKAAIKDTSNDMNASMRGAVASGQAMEQLGTSYDDTKKRMAALSVEIRRTDDPLGKNKATVDKLTKEYDELNDKLKEIDGTMGNHQKNVGNYENSIRGAANAMAIFQGPLGPISGRINSFATVLSRADTAALAGSKSMKLLAFSMKLLSAVGVPILLIFASMLTFFKKTERGQQALRVITAGLSAAFSVLTDRAIAIGEAMFNAFKNPQEALANLWEGVKNFSTGLVTSLIDRVKAVPDFYKGVLDQVLGTFQMLGARIKIALADVPIIGGAIDTEKAEKQLEEANKRIVQGMLDSANAIKTIYGVDFITDLFAGAAEGAKKLFDEAKGRADEAMALETRMNQIIVRGRDLMKERAEMEMRTSQAREDSRDFTISAEERLRALVEVQAEEEALMEKELKLEQDRLAVMIDQLNISESKEEAVQAVAEQEVALFNLEKTHSERMRTINRDRFATEREIRERNVRLARFDFDMAQRRRTLEIEAEAQKLENMGEMLRAEQLRQAEDELTLKQRKDARLKVLEAEFLNQKFLPAQAAQMAHDQWEIEQAEKKEEDKQRIRDLEIQAEQQKLAVISGFINAANDLFFNNNKALAVAGVIVDTYAGIQKALVDGGPTLLTRIAAAATVAMTGASNVRKILAVKRGSKSVDSGGAGAPQINTQFGFTDVDKNNELTSMAVAQNTGMTSGNMSPTIVLEGDLNTELLAIKVREGNNAISGKTLSIGV